jgi:purine-nucleoside phosphorylase
MQGRAAVVFQGRFHLYEGYPPRDVVYPIRVMQALGVRILIVTNAAGGLNPGFQPGDIMRISDHINLTGENPLVGPNEPEWGVRFPDMSCVYDPGLADQVQNAARTLGWSLQNGVYAGLKGPSLETPAEIRFLTTIGADAVGLSTVQEVIAAVHADMRILGLSVITNVNHPDRPVPATLEEIIAVADQAAPRLARLIHHFLERLEPS